MMALIGGVRGIIAAVGGAAVALCLFMAWNTIWDNPRRYAEGRDFGAAQERVLWEEARRKIEAQKAEQKRQAQAELDAAEKQAAEAKRLADEAYAAFALSTEMEKLPGKDDVVLPKSAADALNKIGR